MVIDRPAATATAAEEEKEEEEAAAQLSSLYYRSYLLIAILTIAAANKGREGEKTRSKLPFHSQIDRQFRLPADATADYIADPI